MAISLPKVTSDMPVMINASENKARGKDEGLKMCVRRPSLSQRIRSLAANPTATMRKCRKNDSGLNQRTRMMLQIIGNAANPMGCLLRRDERGSRSGVYGDI